MNRVDQATQWVYRGIWGILSEWFRVPSSPPTLPVVEGTTNRSFKPSTGFLRYLKLKFWVVLTLIDGLIVLGWLGITIASPLLGAILALPALAVAVLPDVVAYVAIHLRYDTTWYVMSDRSLRIRSGIWTIHEMTFTFDNVQNVLVTQGPLQRMFGFADVIVETAGGGGAMPAQGHHQPLASAHRGIIEGVANAPEIRELILQHLRQTKSAGLGDEDEEAGRLQSVSSGWTQKHVELLTAIRDEAKGLIKTSSPT